MFAFISAGGICGLLISLLGLYLVRRDILKNRSKHQKWAKAKEWVKFDEIGVGIAVALLGILSIIFAERDAAALERRLASHTFSAKQATKMRPYLNEIARLQKDTNYSDNIYISADPGEPQQLATRILEVARQANVRIWDGEGRPEFPLPPGVMLVYHAKQQKLADQIKGMFEQCGLQVHETNRTPRSEWDPHASPWVFIGPKEDR